MVMDPLDIEGCVNGVDVNGNPCWVVPPPPVWTDPLTPSDPSEWAQYPVKKTPWGLLLALAAGAAYFLT